MYSAFIITCCKAKRNQCQPQPKQYIKYHFDLGAEMFRQGCLLIRADCDDDDVVFLPMAHMYFLDVLPFPSFFFVVSLFVYTK